MTAYEFMRAGQFQKATAPLEQAYRAKPLGEQPRSLVLNHAMLDVMQKINAMRAVKDLREYMRMHPEPDELVVNLLGAALQTSAKTPRVIQTDLFQNAVKQLEQGVAALEQTRPGEHKWGNKWYNEVGFHDIRMKLDESLARLRTEQDDADRLKGDWQAALAEVQRYNTLNMGTVHVHRDPNDAWSCPICYQIRINEQRRQTAMSRATAAEGRYKAQQLIADRAKADVPQPDWMMDFTPIDPAAPGPASILAPNAGPNTLPRP